MSPCLFQALLSRLNAMRLTASSTNFLKVMDRYGVAFDKTLAKEKQKGVEMMKGKLEKEAHSLDLQSVGGREAPLDAASSQMESVIMQAATVKPVALNAVPPPAIAVIDDAVVDPKNGFNVVVDNWDLRQEVQHMTSDHQNTDIHWVNHNLVENRVSGNHLPDDRPVKDVLDVENKDLIPSFADHKELYNNYLVHIQRILTRRIPALQWLSNQVPKHIWHKHSQEMRQPSKKVQF